MSGNLSPVPEQNNLSPPPVPVDSTMGVGNLPKRPKFSAAMVIRGYNVVEPTMRIWSRANAGAAQNKINNTPRIFFMRENGNSHFPHDYLQEIYSFLEYVAVMTAFARASLFKKNPAMAAEASDGSFSASVFSAKTVNM